MLVINNKPSDLESVMVKTKQIYFYIKIIYK